MSLSGVHILVGVTGSVAAIRAPRLVSALLACDAEVQVIVTDAAKAFVGVEGDLEVRVHTNDDEWGEWRRLGDPVLHIELRRWADVFLIAPLSANTLAKMTAGMCDNLLTCVARAWRVGQGGAGPMVVAPAMNSEMWLHPVTEGQVRKLTEWGVTVVLPVEKKLACGDVGVGAMEAPEKIVEVVVEVAGRKVQKEVETTVQ